MARSARRYADIIIGKGLITAEAVASELRLRLARLLARQRRKLSTPEILSQARQLLAAFEPVLAANVADAQIASWILGAGQLANQLPGWALREIEGRSGLILPPGPLPTAKGLTEIRLPVIDKAVQDLQSRRIVTRPRFDQLSETIRRESFTVARLDSLKTIERLRDILMGNVEEGSSYTAFRDEVAARLGASPIGPAHLENVFRTNTQSAYAGGHETVARNPIVKRVFPFAMIMPIDDGRVRDTHLSLKALGLNGTAIYWSDDPMWSLFTPPIEWQ